jgi:U3 small nucleolar RNA-associated protein 11
VEKSSSAAQLRPRNFPNSRSADKIIFVSALLQPRGKSLPAALFHSPPLTAYTMSSLRNAVSRRPHKERAQPASREKWGLLEKHKDYSLRAQDYNTKKKKLSQLSQKARERNPDEFAFGMIRSGKAGLGKHKSGSSAPTEDEAGKSLPTGKPLSHDAVKLLKTQDAGYLRTVAAKGRREIERLNQEVGLDSVTMDKQTVGRKFVFEDVQNQDSPLSRGKKRDSEGMIVTEHALNGTDSEQIAASMTPAPSTASLPHENTRPEPRSRKTLKAEEDALTRLKAERKRRKRLQDMRVAKLEALKKRQREILAAADQLDLQRAMMARAVGGVNKDGVKFKIRERKR